MLSQSPCLAPELMNLMMERLRALSDEARLRLLIRLREGECNVSSLVVEVGIAQASVSKHLAVLRQAGIVAVRRSGTQAFYRVVDPTVFQVYQLTCDSVKRDKEELARALGAGNLYEI